MKFLHRIIVLALTGVCCLGINSAIGQSPWSVGGHLSGGFSGKNETTFFQSDPSGSNQSYNRVTQRRQPLVGGGLWGAYAVGRYLKIRLGMEYLQAHSFHTFESGSYNTLGVFNDFQERKWKVQLHQLQFPFQVEWYISQRSWRPFVSVGLASQVSLGGKISSDYFLSRRGFENVHFSEGLQMDWRSPGNRSEAWSIPVLFSAGIERGKFTLMLRHVAGQGFTYDGMYTIPENFIWEIYPYYWIRETDVRRNTSIQVLYQIF